MGESNVTLSLEAALALSPVNLGIYVKGMALLAGGRRAFSLTDLGEDLTQVRGAVGQLLDMGLVVHKGGGWYALAKLPSRRGDSKAAVLTAKMQKAASKASSRKRSLPALYKDALLKAAASAYSGNLPPAIFAISGYSNRVRYARIIRAVTEVGATAELFADFVFQHDWSWARDGHPSLGLLCTDDFLGKFRWFVDHEQDILRAREMLSLYGSTFSASVTHKYGDCILMLQLSNMLQERGATLHQFLECAASFPWKAYKGIPPINLLASTSFVDRCCAVMRQQGYKVTSFTYLERIVSRLHYISSTDISFEDCNWSIGEVILEPLASIASGMDQLSPLVHRVVNSKEEPVLGFYLISYDKKLSPLAVYLIVLAKQRLETTFSSSMGLDRWKDIVKEWASSVVDLSVLDLTF